jgi:signal transduction histidine kinase
LQKLNRVAYVEQQTAAAHLYAMVHQRLWRTLGFSILASFVIGLLSALQAGRLERRLRTQQERDARTTVELQHLSARLVNAQEEERRSIARELHDEIGQILTAVKMELSHAQRQVAAGNRWRWTMPIDYRPGTAGRA